MGVTNSKLENMMAYGGAAKYQSRVAANIHRVWQASQPVTADGRRRPRFKTVRGTEPGESSKEVDIANVPFSELPDKYKTTNMNAAQVVVSEILRHVKTRDMNRVKKLDLDFVEVAAHFTHQQWITEHQHSSDTNALIPYYLLPRSGKNLLRKVVRMGIDLYDPDQDRLDNRLFPPRALVVVPLPNLEEDAAPAEAKAWEAGSDVTPMPETQDDAEAAKAARLKAEEDRKQAAEARLKAAQQEEEKRRKDPLHHYTEEDLKAHADRDLVRFQKAVHRDVLIEKLHKPKIINVRRSTGVDV